MKKPNPKVSDDHLELCEVCGAEIWHSKETRHARSKLHRAAVARRARERTLPESRGWVRVLVRLEIASMPRGASTGERSYAWRSLPRAAVPLLSTALYEVLERFTPKVVGAQRDSELWRESESLDREPQPIAELELAFEGPT